MQQIDGLLLRRARRTDFMTVMRLLAHSGLTVPPADRPTLRRFRNLVGDLGCDLYLAFRDEELAGLVHVTYSRQLAGAQRAEVALLAAAGAARDRAASALLQLAVQRARRRGCALLACAAKLTPGVSPELHGFVRAAQSYELQLDADAADRGAAPARRAEA